MVSSSELQNMEKGEVIQNISIMYQTDFGKPEKQFTINTGFIKLKIKIT